MATTRALLATAALLACLALARPAAAQPPWREQPGLQQERPEPQRPVRPEPQRPARPEPQRPARPEPQRPEPRPSPFITCYTPTTSPSRDGAVSVSARPVRVQEGHAEVCAKWRSVCKADMPNCSVEDVRRGVLAWSYSVMGLAKCNELKRDRSHTAVVCCKEPRCNAPDPSTDIQTRVIGPQPQPAVASVRDGGRN